MSYLVDSKNHRLLRLYTRENIGDETFWSITPYLFCASCKKVIHEREGISPVMRAETKSVDWVRKLLNEMRGKTTILPNKKKRSFRF